MKRSKQNGDNLATPSGNKARRIWSWFSSTKADPNHFRIRTGRSCFILPCAIILSWQKLIGALNAASCQAPPRENKSGRYLRTEYVAPSLQNQNRLHALTTLNQYFHRLRTHSLLNNESFQLDPGERVGLLAATAKEVTLMKIIAGNTLADHGDIWRSRD